MKEGMGGAVTSLNVFDSCYTSQSFCTGQNDSSPPKGEKKTTTLELAARQQTTFLKQRSYRGNYEIYSFFSQMKYDS